MKSYLRGIVYRLDTFLVEEIDSSYNEAMMKFLRIVFCLSHGQADVERGFSANKELLVENLNEESLIAQRLVKDHIRRRCEGTVEKMVIGKENTIDECKKSKTKL